MYRFLTALIEPLSFGLICALVVTALMWRRRRGRRRRLIILTVILVFVALACTNLVGHPAIGTLEWRYPSDAPLPDKADAIVVLASGLRVLNAEGTSFELDPSTLFRCLKAAEVYHHAGPCLVVTSGGKSWAGAPGPSPAQAMKDFLIRVGVSPSDILVEGQSRTTYENALLTCKQLEGRRLEQVVLVTDASHMFRSECCFEGLDCPVTPVACYYLSAQFNWQPRDFLPSHDGVLKVERAFHEWVGILWYWINGRLG